MADLNTNDLYKMIGDAKTQADQVAAMAKAQPTFTENFGNTLRSQDSTLSSAVGNYSDAVAQLFAHDKAMAASNTSFAPNDPMYFSNPVQNNKYDAALFAQRGQVVADSLKNLETRKAVLGDVVDKAVQMYQSLLKGKEADYNAKKDELASALSLLQAQETERSHKANEAIDWAKLKASTTSTGGTGIQTVDQLSDAVAVAKVKELFGPNIDLGAVQKERGARAKSLLAKIASGGKIDYMDLLSEKDVKALDEATTSLVGVDRAIATFNKYDGGKSQPGGTGPLIGKASENSILSSWLVGDKESDMRRAVTDVGSAYQKFLSGVAVSAQEMARLEGFLPSKFKDEKKNYDDLKRLKAGMQINLELDKIAKLNKLSPDEAYNKYGKQVFEKYGESFPGSNSTKIKVIELKTGQTGTIEESEFDPALYRKL